MVPEARLKTLLLAGPTAVGKSGLVIELAERLLPRTKIEIINADSVCFYREFNIGSAKPTLNEQARVPHHLVDIVNPLEHYHAGQFLADCNLKIQEIRARGATPVIVGGSGFYLKALRQGLWDAPPTSEDFRKSVGSKDTLTLYESLLKYDPAHALKIGPQDRYRIIRALEIIELSGKRPSELEAEMNKEPDPKFAFWVLERTPEELAQRIHARIVAMIAAGWIEEVMRLRDQFPTSRTLRAVGYQQVLDFLNGVEPEGRNIEPGITGLVEEIALAHRQLAKQQRTWIKGLRPEATFMLTDPEAKLAFFRRFEDEFKSKTDEP